MLDLFALNSLALAAGRVVELRLVRLAWGGPTAWIETHLMVFEKIIASIEAMGTLLTGGSAQSIIALYREHVAANTERLTASCSD